MVATGGWFVIVSHIHPSTAEGMAFLSETLVPALQEESCPDSVRRNTGEEEEEKEGGASFWSVDVHCGDDGDTDGGGREESEEGRGAEEAGGDEDCRRGVGHDDDGASGQIGPSAYMARKVDNRVRARK